MKKKLVLLMSAVAVLFTLLQACSDDIGPVSQCNNCNSDFPWSTDGSDTCYETKAACESAEGVDCFVCL